MVYKNLSIAVLLFLSHSVMPMDPTFTPNRDLEGALRSYNTSKVKKTLATMPLLTQEECNYYHRILSSEGSVLGIHPSGGTAERLAVPTLLGTPSLAILAIIFGTVSYKMKKAIKHWEKSVPEVFQTQPFKYYGLKSLYYSLLVVTGASILGSLGLASAFAFHSYYPSKERKILKLLGKHKQQHKSTTPLI